MALFTDFYLLFSHFVAFETHVNWIPVAVLPRFSQFLEQKPHFLNIPVMGFIKLLFHYKLLISIEELLQLSSTGQKHSLFVVVNENCSRFEVLLFDVSQ